MKPILLAICGSTFITSGVAMMIFEYPTTGKIMAILGVGLFILIFREL